MNSKWEQFRPSKVLWFWSCAGCVALTMALGFTVGGWVTGGTAGQMVEDAQEDAWAQLAADICVAKFQRSVNFPTALSDLTAVSSWTRADFVTEGCGLPLPGLTEQVAGAGGFL